VLRVWNLTTGEKLRELRGHTGSVLGVALSADGSRAISAGHDGVLPVWDLTAGKQLYGLQGHTGSVLGVALSADGSRAISAGDDRVLCVWDLVAGKQLHAIALLPSGEYATLARERSADATSRDQDAATHREAPPQQSARVLACSAGAWRWLGWLAPAPSDGELTRYPAETFGALPVKADTLHRHAPSR
jgi:hypothetical protein